MSLRILGIGLAAIFLSAITADLAVAKKWFDNPNSGYCKSLKKATDLKKCKENGGRK